MPGKISGLDSTQPPPGGAAGVGPRSPGQSAGSAAAATGAVIQITDTANQLATVEQTLNAVPVVNQARVADLGSAIEQGSYEVQPERIASQLLQFERLLPEDPAG